LELEPTEDIVRSVVDHRGIGTLVIAFAAEMGLDIDRARQKLHRKGVDAIVLNDISRSDIGFESDRNAAVFITEELEVHLEELSKDDLAAQILDQVVAVKVQQHAQLHLP
jgi:phosphopantothenoylcysteine decarboxylase/phosphopantothenate--cysteine ligase